MSTAWFLINAELRSLGREISTVSEDEHCLIYAVAVNLAEEEIETVNSFSKLLDEKAEHVDKYK